MFDSESLENFLASFRFAVKFDHQIKKKDVYIKWNSIIMFYLYDFEPERSPAGNLSLVIYNTHGNPAKQSF